MDVYAGQANAGPLRATKSDGVWGQNPITWTTEFDPKRKLVRARPGARVHPLKAAGQSLSQIAATLTRQADAGPACAPAEALPGLFIWKQ